MKRVFAHIGFSTAVTLLAVNLIGIQAVPAAAVGVGILFFVSLLLPRYRRALAVPLCFGAALFACLLYITVYQATVAPALALDGVEAQSSLYLTSLPVVKQGSYVYTAKAVRILADGAPQRN